jgi:hypothetical protein
MHQVKQQIFGYIPRGYAQGTKLTGPPLREPEMAGAGTSMRARWAMGIALLVSATAVVGVCMVVGVLSQASGRTALLGGAVGLRQRLVSMQAMHPLSLTQSLAERPWNIDAGTELGARLCFLCPCSVFALSVALLSLFRPMSLDIMHNPLNDDAVPFELLMLVTSRPFDLTRIDSFLCSFSLCL